MADKSGGAFFVRGLLLWRPYRAAAAKLIDMLACKHKAVHCGHFVADTICRVNLRCGIKFTPFNGYILTRCALAVMGVIINMTAARKGGEAETKC